MVMMHGSTGHTAALVTLDMAVSRAIDVFPGSIRHSGGAHYAGIFTASIVAVCRVCGTRRGSRGRGEVGPAALLAVPVRLDTAISACVRVRLRVAAVEEEG